MRELEEERKETVANLYFWMPAYGIFFFLPYLYMEGWILSTFFSIDGNILFGIIYFIGEFENFGLGILGVCGVFFIFPFIGWIFLYTSLTENYINEFRRKVISKIIKFVDPNLMHSPYQYVSSYKFNKSKIFDRVVEHDGDDYVSGKVGHTFIEFSDVTNQEFEGIFYVADFNKTFASSVYVLPGKSFSNKLFKSSQKRDKYQVVLENPEFEQRYSTYCKDQNVARYILTPTLMEKFVKLSKILESIGYSGVSISFVGQHLNMAVPYHDMLKIDLYTPLYESADPLTYFEDLMLFFSVVKELDLNTRIWSKRSVAEAIPKKTDVIDWN